MKLRSLRMMHQAIMKSTFTLDNRKGIKAMLKIWLGTFATIYTSKLFHLFRKNNKNVHHKPTQANDLQGSYSSRWHWGGEYLRTTKGNVSFRNSGWSGLSMAKPFSFTIVQTYRMTPFKMETIKLGTETILWEVITSIAMEVTITSWQLYQKLVSHG